MPTPLFFLYYAPHNAHEPRVPSPAFKNKSKAGIYGDVIEEFDYYVGKIIQTLKRNRHLRKYNYCPVK